MFCVRCGKKNVDGARFCYACGYDMSQGTPQESRTSNSEACPQGQVGPTGTVLLGAEIESATGLPVGTRVAGRYCITQRLGQGGMGSVYLATDERLATPVALKFINPQLWQSKAAYQRFLQEATTCLSLAHPNIIRVYHLDEWQGRTYLAMEYLNGETLRTAMDRIREKGKLFDWRTISALMQQMLAGVGYAHLRGVIHRDLKPANVMLVRERDNRQRVVVMDFGLAKRTESEGLTWSGTTLGTPYYMAPEQHGGAADVDHRADIYSLGVIAYELMTGQLPVGHTIPPSELRGDLPNGVDLWVFKAIEHDRDKRFATAHEMLRALRMLGSEVRPEAVAVPPQESDSARKPSATPPETASASTTPPPAADSPTPPAAEKPAPATAATPSEAPIPPLTSLDVLADSLQRYKQAAAARHRRTRRIALASAVLLAGVALIYWAVSQFLIFSPPVVLPPPSSFSVSISPETTSVPIKSVSISTPEIPDGNGWVSLFNGQDLTGWQAEGGGTPVSWKAQAGILSNTGQGMENLSTVRQYADFELALEFKLLPAGNSGVFLRHQGPGPPEKVSMEIQLLDDYDAKYNTLTPHRFCGSLYAIAAAAPAVPKSDPRWVNRACKRANEWQQMTILCAGRILQVTLNGQRVLNVNLDALAAQPNSNPGLKRPSGYIVLQKWDTTGCEFRNIRIRDLGRK